MAIPDGKQSIKSIFIGDRYFKVPNYQRSYAWKEKQLNDFLDDFSHTENYQKYYYGTILLQQKNSDDSDDVYEIVDGQQRLTTLIIFVKCLIDRLYAVGETSEADELKMKYINYKNNYVLQLQDQDDGYFKTYILSDTGKGTPKTPAQCNLSLAKEKCEEALKKCDKDELMEYKKRIQAANCLVYSVQDRNEAAMIFETTNDRGKMLTKLEKTKSYLMYKVSTTLKKSNSLLNTIQQGFNDIYITYETIRGNKKFDLEEDSIQQYAFIAFEDWKNKKINNKSVKAYQHYLDELKEKVNSLVIKVADSLDEESKELNEKILNDYIETYVNNLTKAFNAIKDMFESKSELFYRLIALNRMASIYPLLIKAYMLDGSKNKKDFYELCKWFEIFCFRGLTIMKYQANKYQDLLFNMARDFKGDFESLYREIKIKIIQLGNDDKFIERLKDKDFYHDYYSTDRNYFFWNYENFLREEKSYPLLTFDDLWQTDSKKKLTIEHIVAQKGEKDKIRILQDEKLVKVGQRKFFDKEYLHSIGNLTIDPLSANASKGKDEVEDKNNSYFTKAPLMSQNELNNFMENGKWTIGSIKTRAEKLIAFAKEKWCFETTGIGEVEPEDNDEDSPDPIDL